MSGLLSLQEAMNADLMTFPSLNPHHLELGGIEYMLSHCAFQGITYQGESLLLQTPAIHMSSLKYDRIDSQSVALISVSPWLRQQFDILEDLVRETIANPNNSAWRRDRVYKPLPSGNEIYIILTNPFRVTQETNNGIINKPRFQDLGEGTYSFVIDFSHVYFADHNDGSGHYCSLYYRLKHIHFKPDVVE